jgi:hypothetical protein
VPADSAKLAASSGAAVRVLLDGWEPLEGALTGRTFGSLHADAAGALHASAELLQPGASARQHWRTAQPTPALACACTDSSVRHGNVPFYRLRFSLPGDDGPFGEGHHWNVWHRYSDFRAMAALVKRQLPAMAAKPPPRTFGKTSGGASEAFLRERAAKLGSFMQALLATPGARDSPVVRSFIGVYAPPAGGPMSKAALKSPVKKAGAAAAAPGGGGCGAEAAAASIFRSHDDHRAAPAAGDELGSWLASLTAGRSLLRFRSELGKLGAACVADLADGDGAELVFESDLIAMGMTDAQRALFFAALGGAAAGAGAAEEEEAKGGAGGGGGGGGLAQMKDSCEAEEVAAEQAAAAAAAAAALAAKAAAAPKKKGPAPALSIQYCGG